MKPYLSNLSLSQARSRMRLRAKVFGSAKFNFQSDPKFLNDNWLCLCGCIQSQRHQEVCFQYEDLRKIYNLKVDKDLVAYFDEILKRQMTNE